MDIDLLASFLKKAKKNTYASETAKKAESLRPSSRDYEYSEDSLVYHDTYFGGTSFMGEEIVYENGNPAWGMNYYGYNIDPNITEAELDKALRGALKQDYDDVIPVRGPRVYRIDNLEYKNDVSGDLSRFDGKEEITKDGKLIYSAIFHGGFIK